MLNALIVNNYIQITQTDNTVIYSYYKVNSVSLSGSVYTVGVTDQSSSSVSISNGTIYTISLGFGGSTSGGGGGSVTLNNNTNNFIVTMSGTASTLDGEPYLQYNASTNTFWQDAPGHTFLGTSPLFGVSSYIASVNTLTPGRYNGEIIFGRVNSVLNDGGNGINFGQIVYLNAGGFWDLANANGYGNEWNENLLGICLGDGAGNYTASPGGNMDILLKGYISTDWSAALYTAAWNATRTGQPIYLAGRDS